MAVMAANSITVSSKEAEQRYKEEGEIKVQKDK